MDIKSAFVGVRWGEKGLVSLYVSVLSGIVVAFQYNPAEPLYSTSTMDLLVPFGRFWRSLHFYSSQFFFLLTVVHLVAILMDRWPQPMPMRKWVPLICSLPVIVLLLFTGYVLRGDVTGEMAGQIAENIVLAIPVAGRWFNELLFAISSDGVLRVYANHLVGLGVLWGVLSWDHLRKYRVSLFAHGGLLTAMVLTGLLAGAPMEPERMGVFHIAGPWFFIGLQELLRYLPPFWAGVVWPATFMFALVGTITHDSGARRRLWWFAVTWLIVYGILTWIGFAR
ncbi:MAG: cytochrome b N-terminal domain-containing protein [Desulfobulbaceae bacterium]|nr:cytochrome b N-terminal domain-containing protein [Desulfobulbaceae bacterium]